VLEAGTMQSRSSGFIFDLRDEAFEIGDVV
jgi:hypothetical protein